MKKQFYKGLQQNFVAILAISAFIFFGSMNNPNETAIANSTAAASSTGYSISLSNLKKFMIDSLGTKNYEGGMYSKQDLLRVLNSFTSDTVYLLNGMLGCDVARGTGLALASPSSASVGFVNWYAAGYCYPCPLRACCPKKFCVINTNRRFVDYIPYTSSGFTSADGAIAFAEE
ncbi:hypothetical protein [Limnovirga soli]|uniref:Uncharacterized protein n=1 Tax=Limnovirga soli TaxID=2656915 RepID=A0A8J8FDG4_9BACT|nr:hypothetical protein [Limnovirga soli]NNV54359.1 hypothetical protein [Limnovirga soli]